MAHTKEHKLSIVVIFHDMPREAERTLHTLSDSYQLGISVEDYNVIAIDNGSVQRLDPQRVESFGSNFEYRYFETESPSPAASLNFGAQIAQGEYVACIVDGARMVTPGLVSHTMTALQAVDHPFVCALTWHLGPDVQNISITKGYDQLEEDRLLESIDWRHNGYRLFEIAAIAQSSKMGFGGGIPDECSWFAMRRTRFLELGGYDEKFQSPGGGLMNHDLLGRVLLSPDISPWVILGEGTFHQIHGGVATNVPMEKHPFAEFADEYRRIRGCSYKRPSNPTPRYIGTVPPVAMRFVLRDKDVVLPGCE